MHRIAIFLLLTLCAVATHVMADEAVTSDEQHIRSLMQQTWDKSDAHLEIPVLVIADKHAIASWLQGDRGGRALLAKREGQWQVLVCGGDGLKTVGFLQQSGLPVTTAQSLVNKLQQAEAGLPDATQKQFSLFGKEIPMEHSTHHP